MVRWKYLVPRLGILLIVLLLINVFGSPLSRMLIIATTQAFTGARVDVGTVQTSVFEGSVRVKDLQIADPRNPMKNLVQANTAEFKLDPSHLTHRRWVINNAQLSGVQFGTPRTESGALPSCDKPKERTADSLVDFTSAQLHSFSQRWIDEIAAQIPSLVESNLETVQVGRQLEARWPTDLERELEHVNQLKERAVQLKNVIEDRSGNPLRELERYQNAMDEFRELFADIENAKQNLHSLSTRFSHDKQDLLAAIQRDRQKIIGTTRGTSISAQSMSEMLLGEQKVETVQELVSWLNWFQQIIPDPEEDFQPQRLRGYDVEFEQHPKFVFQRLQLDGEGYLAGQNIHFAGTAKNVTTNPKLHDQPMSVELRGQGQTHVVVLATVDRRGAQKIDSIEISCPKISAPAKILGDSNSLSVGVQPSEISFHATARIVDNQLTGQLRMNYSNIQMRVENIHDSLGDERLTSVLNNKLNNIDRFDVVIKFNGDLNNPNINLDSDLGDRFAAILSDSFRTTVEQAAKSNLARLDTIAKQQIVEFDQMFQENTGEIMNVLTNEIPAVASLDQMRRDNQLAWPIRR